MWKWAPNPSLQRDVESCTNHNQDRGRPNITAKAINNVRYWPDGYIQCVVLAYQATRKLGVARIWRAQAFLRSPHRNPVRHCCCHCILNLRIDDAIDRLSGVKEVAKKTYCNGEQIYPLGRRYAVWISRRNSC
jgi:hypothetical protein